MPRRLHIARGNEQFDLVETKAANELTLQEILLANPQLVPAEDLGFDQDLLVVGRETSLAAGYIDLLCLASTGDLVLIELKTGKQNPDFRHALAQVIDYGSDLWHMSLEDFDRGVVQAYLASRHRSAPSGASSLRELIATTRWQLEPSELEALESRLSEVLVGGDFTFVVVAQHFTPSMESSVAYLNDVATRGRYFLIELVELRGNDLVAYSAQVVARPEPASSARSSARSLAGEEEFLATITDPAYRDALADLLARCRSLGLRTEWGVHGTALRMPVVDTAEPLSVGWLFGAQPAWLGLTHLTLGYDASSLKTRPSVHDAVATYARKVAELPGATRVAKGSLVAVTLTPEQVIANVQAVQAELQDLVDSQSL